MFANLRVIKSAWPLIKMSAGHLVMIGGGTARTPDCQRSLVSAVNGVSQPCRSPSPKQRAFLLLIPVDRFSASRFQLPRQPEAYPHPYRRVPGRSIPIIAGTAIPTFRQHSPVHRGAHS
jgi:hypothetical protein